MKETFGQFIRRLRNQDKLTLTQLAAKLDLDSANLSKIENGKRNFDEKKIGLLCSIFNLDSKQIEKGLISEKIVKNIYSYNESEEILILAESKLKYYKAKKL
ncbi:MAG: helix-turn-helix domain-containing protein [Planctomycetes bacterium]|nr:helix-turn-helix domain-containing protein [Planctomycetota bacterium]